VICFAAAIYPTRSSLLGRAVEARLRVCQTVRASIQDADVVLLDKRPAALDPQTVQPCLECRCGALAVLPRPASGWMPPSRA